MAATLQDVSSKLMRPAKDLAEWNFPLAQILEDYYTLLNEPCDLNFGEAALVLQNSANVYVRRVECLFQETTALSQSINDHEQKESSATDAKPRKHVTKSKIDFDNFELISFTKQLSNNINLKPAKEEKKIKLLTRRYPQLENIVRNKFPLKIMDTNGEVIGKKYDFRCNEQLSISKVLVDELTPNDFVEKKKNNNIAEISETDLEVVNAFDSCSEFCDSFRDAGVFSPTQESAYGSTISNSDVNTPSSRDLSDFSQTLNDSLRDPKDSLSPIDSEKSLITSSETENVKTSGMNSCLDRTSRIRDSIETDAGYTSGDPDDMQQQSPLPPKKIRRITRSSVVNELNEDTWKPIPFDDNVPDKLPKSRSEFKLPCHIKLLKYTPRSRKKKLSENSIKRKNLKRYLMNENDDTKDESECDRKKLLLYSPTKSIFYQLQDEIDELQKLIEQCFKSKSQINGSDFQAVENSKMDLLGFEWRLKQFNDLKDSENTEKIIEHSNVIEEKGDEQLRLSPPPEASCSYTPPQSPASPSHFNVGEIEQSERTHQQRIEEKMKHLQQEFDVRNDRENETKKWYQMIHALESVERRPTFHVHEYEKTILNTLETEKTHRLSFETITKEQEPDDIARLFVASLHLANTYSVEIDVVQSNENSHMNLTLLEGDPKHHT